MNVIGHPVFSLHGTHIAIDKNKHGNKNREGRKEKLTDGIKSKIIAADWASFLQLTIQGVHKRIKI